MVGDEGCSAGSYLADPTSPIPSHCAVNALFESVLSASIVVTSTLRVNGYNDIPDTYIRTLFDGRKIQRLAASHLPFGGITCKEIWVSSSLDQQSEACELMISDTADE